ncbi:glycoside hydrolase family 5 protein [Auriscalpium vulgare]|uniref:Glycoside hydrolase family 5 protein n=1 Tax=Auriscalpium vulgare TaxID=40419 RepID=A0ACB8RL52_9AGAM|nr:glycoside hydrolase family 5 protein [Auriscalpium vulgare]
MDKIKSFLNKHGSEHAHSQPILPSVPQAPPSLTVGFPNAQDLYRYRKQRGINLGSWFVLERWIADAPYRAAASPGQSDHDVARGSDARHILEEHWDNWITENDWRWIAERGFNTVRIPIGFYELCGIDPSVLVGTDFASLGHIFEGAWPRIMTAIATAHRFGLGVLIDIHAAPGKQNQDSHSGTSSKQVSFFNSSNFARTTRILTSLLAHLSAFTRAHNPPLPNVVGIELVNEPNPPDSKALQQWYRTTIAAMRQVDPDMPLYIGDSWRTDEYAGFIKSLGDQSPSSHSSFMALDHHLYRCFTSSDNSTPAWKHAQNLRTPSEGTPGTFERVSSALASVGAGLVVGEWSGALNPGSLHGVSDEITAKRDFVNAQLALYEQHCAGWFWWTYKKQSAGDSGWSMRDAVDKGVFPLWVGICVRRQLDQDPGRVSRREVAQNSALGDHAGWWAKYPDGKYEHWRFAEGFAQGWEDAYVFLTSGSPNGSAPEIGFKAAWAKRRATEHARTKGNRNVWEYEHGLVQGIDAAKSDFRRICA